MSMWNAQPDAGFQELTNDPITSYLAVESPPRPLRSPSGHTFQRPWPIFFTPNLPVLPYWRTRFVIPPGSSSIL